MSRTMLIESALTAYMRLRSRRILRVESEPRELAPPNPKPGKKYLLYIHVPFCHELCPYCSFNRVRFDRTLAADYFSALADEIGSYADRGFDFSAVYVGGGTPTVMPEELAEILSFVRKRWTIEDISAETNPDHLTTPVLRVLKDAGVNRMSVGVQSLSDHILKSVNRYDKYGSAAEIIRGIENASGIFDTLNIDMIFNFPNQDGTDVLRDIEILLGLAPDQITWYPLMASRAARKQMDRELGASSLRREKELYHLICAGLSERYDRTTAWCFSRDRGMIDEYVVDHDEYVGVGPGSFSYLSGTMYSNTFSVPGYVTAIEAGRSPLSWRRVFSPRERVQYDLLMQLFGGRFSLTEAAAKFGSGVRRMLWKEMLFLTLTGAAALDDGEITLRDSGSYYLFIMMREFFTGVNNFREIMSPPAVATPVDLEGVGE